MKTHEASLETLLRNEFAAFEPFFVYVPQAAILPTLLGLRPAKVRWKGIVRGIPNDHRTNLPIVRTCCGNSSPVKYDAWFPRI